MGTAIEIRQAGAIVEVMEGETILSAALRAGIPYPHGCRSGRCGACKSRLVHGSVDLLPHTPFALTPLERTEGLILACRAVPTVPGRVSWLEGGDLAEHPVQRLVCRVVEVSDATHDIRCIRLAPEARTPLTFTAGQYARLRIGGAPSRDYSMANRPDDPILEFHIRHVPGGIVSGRARHLQVGDSVQVEGPFGSSHLRERHTGPVLCVAGGSGLAPIKSIVEAALAAGMRQPIQVYFGARHERDLYLTERFRALAAAHPNLAFTPVLSAVPRSLTYRTGLVSEALATDLADLDGWKVYAAGPPAMIDAVGLSLSRKGLRMQDLHADVFFTPDLATP